MDKRIKEDLDAIEALLKTALSEGLAYLQNLNHLPTSVRAEEVLRKPLEEKGMSGLDAFNPKLSMRLVSNGRH